MTFTNDLIKQCSGTIQMIYMFLLPWAHRVRLILLWLLTPYVMMFTLRVYCDIRHMVIMSYDLWDPGTYGVWLNVCLLKRLVCLVGLVAASIAEQAWVTSWDICFPDRTNWYWKHHQRDTMRIFSAVTESEFVSCWDPWGLN